MEMTRLTSKYQATVPLDVRKHLGLKAGDTIRWDVVDGVANVRKVAREDKVWLSLSEGSFAAEWLSPEDEAAWRDL